MSKLFRAAFVVAVVICSTVTVHTSDGVLWGDQTWEEMQY